MAFFGAAIAGVLSLGAIGTALVNIAVVAVAFAAIRFLTPKAEQPELDSSPTDLSLDTEHPREAIIGECLVGGSLIYARTYGRRQKSLQLVIALSDTPCDSLLKVVVNGVEYGWNSTTKVVAGHKNLLKVTFFSDVSAAPSVLVNNSGLKWLLTDRFVGGTWVLVEAEYDPETFPNGIPRLSFRVRGMPLYDPRLDSTNGGSGSHRWENKDTWAYSNNPVLVWYMLRRGYVINGERIFGMRTPAEAFDHAEVRAEAEHCDTGMPRKGDLSNEKRYRFNGVIQATPGGSSHVSAIVSATAGEEIDSAGKVRFLVGVARNTVATITDADLRDRVRIKHRSSANHLINAVYGSYHEPDNLFQETGLPPRISPADEEIDNGRFEQHYHLAYVTSHWQGQRVTEIMRRLGRQQLTLSTTLRGGFAGLEAGDWVLFTSTRYGFTNKVLKVISSSLNDAFELNISLREINSAVYDWTNALELDVTAPSDLTAGTGTVDSSVDNFTVSAISILGEGGKRRPAIRLDWDDPDDARVTHFDVEYRVQGQSTALTSTAPDPKSQRMTIAAGIQSGVLYEARLLPRTNPPRSTGWTDWAVAADATPVFIVDAGSITIPNNSITILQLIQSLRTDIQRIPILDSSITSYGQRLGTAESNIGIVMTATTRHDRFAGLVLNESGNVTGMLGLSSNGTNGSQISMMANRFGFWMPDPNNPNMTVKQNAVFEIGLVAGAPKIIMRGDLYADGFLHTRHLTATTITALWARFLTVRTGKLISNNGRTTFDLDSGELTMTSGS